MAKRGGELDLWWHIGLATVGAGYRALLHCRYHGLDHLPREGPALLASNHVSVLDPIAIALGTASRGRAPSTTRRTTAPSRTRSSGPGCGS